MLAIDLVRFCGEILKRLSDADIRLDDYKYVEMCDEYCNLVESGHKKEYAMAIVTEKYGVSESTVRRAVRRLNKAVKP